MTEPLRSAQALARHAYESAPPRVAVLVPRFPTAILCTGPMIVAFLALTRGLILDSVGKDRHEAKRLNYLALPPLPDADARE